MQSNTKYNIFNFKMYIDALKQLRLIGFISLGLFLLITILMPVGDVLAIIESTKYGSELYTQTISVQGRFSSLTLIYMFVVPILTLYLFSFLTKRNSCDYYHSFPQKRECIYTTYTLAVITWAFIIIAGNTIAAAITYTILNKYLIMSIPSLLHFSLSIFVCSLLVIGAIVLACSLTGTVFTNIIVTGLIIFLPRFIITAIISTITSGHPVLVADSLLPLLDNKYNMIFNMFYTMFNSGSLSFLNWPSLLYTLIIALIYIVIGFVSFKKRHSEVAGNSATGRGLQCIIRVALAIPICIIPLSVIFELTAGNESMTAIDVFGITVYYIIAIIAMLLYELISTKKFINVIKALPSIGILAIANVVLFIGLYALSHILLSFNPDASEINYVKLIENGNPHDKSYFEAKQEDYEIKNETIIQLVADGLTETLTYEETEYPYSYYNNDEQYTSVTVAINTGMSTKYRNIILKNENYEKICEALINSEEIKDIYTNLPLYDSSSMELYSELDETDNNINIYNQLRSELSSVDLKEWYTLVNNNYSYMSLQLQTVYNDSSSFTTLPLTSLTPNTLMKYLNTLNADTNPETFVDSLNKIRNLNKEDSDASIENGGYHALNISTFTDNFEHEEFISTINYNDEKVSSIFDALESLKDNYTEPITSLKKDGYTLARISIDIYMPEYTDTEIKAYYEESMTIYAYLPDEIISQLP